ncbi:MAG: hypothetical protein WBF90_12610 [Rivularia sp. (in: cyanobacteria)]
MESEKNNVSHPDPEWEYYGLWQDVNLAKNNLDEAIKYIAAIENPDDSTDARIAQKLGAVISLLKNCSFAFSEEELEELLEDE